MVIRDQQELNNNIKCTRMTIDFPEVKIEGLKHRDISGWKLGDNVRTVSVINCSYVKWLIEYDGNFTINIKDCNYCGFGKYNINTVDNCNYSLFELDNTTPVIHRCWTTSVCVNKPHVVLDKVLMDCCTSCIYGFRKSVIQSKANIKNMGFFSNVIINESVFIGDNYGYKLLNTKQYKI